MSMPLASHYSAENVRALPNDGNRYETVGGELLVTPSPGGKHQYVLGQLAGQVGNYLAANGLDREMRAPADLSFDADTLVQPDMFVADLGAFTQTWNWADIRTLYLVVEIVSPSSIRADRIIKRRLYQERLVPQYWVVDAEQRQVEVWTPGAEFPIVERETLTWRHPSLDVDCVVNLTALFRFDPHDS